MKNVSLRDNNLLGALDESDQARIAAHLDEIHLPAGHVIHEPGDLVRHAYFPRGDALVSFLVPLSDGESVEAARVGREGAVGGIVSHGQLPAFSHCCVDHSGDFLRIATVRLEEIKAASPHVRRLFNRYADCMVAQLFQSIACNARHSIEQRTARWLCLAVSRTGSFKVQMTQAQLGTYLGVGRSYVTRVLSRLKKDGIVATRRGSIIIENPTVLKRISCDCSAVVASHFDRVLRGVYPA